MAGAPVEGDTVDMLAVVVVVVELGDVEPGLSP